MQGEGTTGGTLTKIYFKANFLLGFQEEPFVDAATEEGGNYYIATETRTKLRSCEAIGMEI